MLHISDIPSLRAWTREQRAAGRAIGFVPKPYRLAELCSFLRAKTKAVSPSAC